MGVQVVNKELWELEGVVSTSKKAEIAESLNKKYNSTMFTPDLVKKWLHPIIEAKKSSKAILTFSDNPHAPGDTQHGLKGIGTRYSWIKMDEEVTLNSLRQALMLSSLRVVSDFESFVSPYTPPAIYLKSMRVMNTHLSEGEIYTEFSSQMTTVIGGREQVNQVLSGF